MLINVLSEARQGPLHEPDESILIITISINRFVLFSYQVHLGFSSGTFSSRILLKLYMHFLSIVIRVKNKITL
jgi:hypothetical protein